MKFLPPEEEIRAQLRQLTSQTRRLRADLEGMITRRGPSDKSFSHDKRYRLKPEPQSVGESEPPAEAEPNARRPETTKSTRRASPKKRR
jgi:hypothetical protein